MLRFVPLICIQKEEESIFYMQCISVHKCFKHIIEEIIHSFYQKNIDVGLIITFLAIKCHPI